MYSIQGRGTPPVPILFPMQWGAGPVSEAVHQYPELVKKYMGSVVPVVDNYYTAQSGAYPCNNYLGATEGK